MVIRKLFFTLCLALSTNAAFSAAPQTPIEAGNIRLDIKPPGRAIEGRHTLLGNSASITIVELAGAKDVAKALLGEIEDVTISSAYFETYEGKVATVGVNLNAEHDRLRSLIAAKYGLGDLRVIPGSDSCSEMHVTAWTGLRSTLVLAIWNRVPEAGAKTATLELRSNRLFKPLMNALSEVPDESECASHPSWR